MTSLETTHPLHLLVMDDEPSVATVCRRMLARLGHSVTLVSNGEEALTTYAAAMETGKRFDLAILDLTIRGGMGGFETIAGLRELDPAVVALASSGNVQAHELSEHGFQGQLPKPYRLDDLRSALDEALGSA